jgi:hypothetical protein
MLITGGYGGGEPEEDDSIKTVILFLYILCTGVRAPPSLCTSRELKDFFKASSTEYT